MKKIGMFLVVCCFLGGGALAAPSSVEEGKLSKCFNEIMKNYDDGLLKALRNQDDLGYATLLMQRASESFACAGLSLDKAVDDLVASGEAFKVSRKTQGSVVDNAKAALYLLDLEGGAKIAVEKRFLSPEVVDRYLKARPAK